MSPPGTTSPPPESRLPLPLRRASGIDGVGAVGAVRPDSTLGEGDASWSGRDRVPFRTKEELPLRDRLASWGGQAVLVARAGTTWAAPPGTGSPSSWRGPAGPCSLWF